MSLNYQYSILVQGDTLISNGISSIEDTVQQLSKFNTNTITNLTIKKIEINALPTFYNNPNSNRNYKIDLDSFGLTYVRSIYIKSNKQFMFNISEDNSDKLLLLTKEHFIEYGDFVESFVPQVPYPKIINVLNPLEVNGGGNGNSNTDTPITISILIVGV